MALGAIPSDAGLLCLQAGLVAAPRALDPRVAARLRRFRGRAWAIIPALSIIGVIVGLDLAPGAAGAITWLALIACPLLCILALGWLVRGARWWLALAVPVLFLLAWRTPGSLWGEGAGALLSGLSCVTLGVLLAAVCPPSWLKLGVLAMAGADAYLVFSTQLQASNNDLNAAAPPSHLPQLQYESWGTVVLGYGDVFVAGVLGALWAARPRPQLVAALVTLGLGGLFDLIFWHDFNTIGLPATVPVAAALVVMEIAERLARARQWAPRPVEAGGRDSSARLVTTSSPRAASSSTSVASSSERA